MDINAARSIVNYWLINGMALSDGMPVCPEFIYRLNGEWVGWTHFLKVHEGHSSFSENAKQDLIEGFAWELYQSIKAGQVGH